MEKYNEEMLTLFDIYCEDSSVRKKKGVLTGVTMSSAEYDFYQNMKSERTGFCQDFVDRKWEAEMKYRVEKEAKLERLRKRKIEEEEKNKKVSWNEVENELSEMEEDEKVDCTEQVTPESRLENSFEVPERRRKRKFCENVSDEDPLPAKYRHIRSSEKKVKPEYYTTVDKIKSTLHCSYKQAAHSVIMVANGLFGRKWKTHDEDENNIDVDTAPHKRRTIEAGHALTALCLSEIVDEMMKAGGGVITYQDDGSRSQGVGGYSVQGININGKFRPLPTLPVASECRENLAALKLAVLSILATCNQDYTATEIHERVTFKVTDATSHNFDVDEMVALKLGTEHVPVHLLCHTHPVLMFSRKIVEVCSEVSRKASVQKRSIQHVL